MFNVIASSPAEQAGLRAGEEILSYGGTRVFGTTLGHGNDTWNDPVFQDLLGRAFKWAVKRE